MALEQRRVKEIVSHAVSREVDIPEFQRPFVWEPDQVKLLAESLYRDYPIGSFLLWDSSDYMETRTAQGSEANLWVVDGQQRSTAMCILLGQKPYWWSSTMNWNEILDRYDVMVNVSPLTNERVEFALSNKERKADPKWISLREILKNDKVEQLTLLAQTISRQIADQFKVKKSDAFTKVHANLQALWQTREAYVPIIKISHEVEDVAEIFARLNKEGTLIREADVILALAAVRNPGWVRQEYLPFVSDLEDRGWKLGAGIFIRTMTGIGLGKSRLKDVPKDFWSPPPFKNIWNRVKTAMSEVLTRFAVYGIFSAELIPSMNSLIPLFVAHHLWKEKSDYSFGKLFLWFLLANRDGRYSGAAITNLDEDTQTIYKADSFEKMLATLQRRLRVSDRVSTDEYLNRYDRVAGKNFLRLVFYLALRDRNAKDWVDKNLIGYDKSGSLTLGGYRPHWHHIFPNSMLKRHGILLDYRHFFGNITILNEQTNVKKLQAVWPTKYIEEFSILPEDLHAHFIPLKFIDAKCKGKEFFQEAWGVNAYQDFVVDRSEEIAKAVNQFLEKL